jgi:hypothetical protein
MAPESLAGIQQVHRERPSGAMASLNQPITEKHGTALPERLRVRIQNLTASLILFQN